MPFGYHLILDLYECHPQVVGSIQVCYGYLDRLPDLIGTSKQAPPYIFYTDEEKYPDKAGLSGWIPLVESGISIHTLTVTNFISIDVYTCRALDKTLIERIKEFTCKTFLPEEFEEKLILRGEKYPSSTSINMYGNLECNISSGKYSVMTTLKVEEDTQRKALWRIYTQSFKDDAAYAQNQRCYNEKTFSDVFMDEDYYKILLTHNNETVGLCLLTKNLEKAKVAYVNPARLEKLYPAYKCRIFYATFIGILPFHRKRQAFSLLVSTIIAFIDKADGICAFDFASEMNADLPNMILRAIEIMKRQRRIKRAAIYETVGIQEYGVIRGLDE